MAESISPGWTVRATEGSTNARDDRLIIPYQMLMMAPKFRPAYTKASGAQTTLADIQFDARAKRPPHDQFGAWILVDIGAGKGDASLIFAQQTPATGQSWQALENNPSSSVPDQQMHRWENVVRSITVQHLVNSGDYGGSTIIIDEDPAQILKTNLLIEEWYSTSPWPGLLFDDDQPVPTRVFWTYPGNSDDRMCLHPDLDLPPLTGITTVRGRTYANANQPGRHFDATRPFVGWEDYAIQDGQVKVLTSLYKRTRITAEAPDPSTVAQWRQSTY